TLSRYCTGDSKTTDHPGFFPKEENNGCWHTKTRRAVNSPICSEKSAHPEDPTADPFPLETGSQTEFPTRLRPPGRTRATAGLDSGDCCRAHPRCSRPSSASE